MQVMYCIGAIAAGGDAGVVREEPCPHSDVAAVSKYTVGDFLP